MRGQANILFIKAILLYEMKEVVVLNTNPDENLSFSCRSF